MMIKSFLREQKARVESLVPYDSFKEPIFIISPPRSGSTWLFESITQFKNLYHFNNESDCIWWERFPYARLKEPSDYIGVEDAEEENIKYIRRQFYQNVVINYIEKHPRESRFLYYCGIKKIRYMDKTIANCFHLEFIERAFPNAQYIFLTRDPRANISSMIEGWPYVNSFGKPQLTSIVRSIATSQVEHWSYPAPPGWQDIVSRSIPEICAWSWQQHIKYALNFFNCSSKKNMMLVRYEDLVRDPINTIVRLGEKLNLEYSHKVKNYLENRVLSKTTISKPDRNKWKEKNYQEVVSILQMIEDTSREIGYKLNE